MLKVSVEDLVTEKILPFNLFSKDGTKIFNAGEVLTPGKILQLRYIPELYRDENEEESQEEAQEEAQEETSQEEHVENINSLEVAPVQSEPTRVGFNPHKTPDIPLDITETIAAGQINKHSKIPSQAQMSMKALYSKALNSSVAKNKTAIFLEARDRIIEEILPIVDNIVFKSQLKILGEYDQTHGVNVAILATVLSSKLKLKDTVISDIALAALLHDIGKTRIDKNILSKNNLTTREAMLFKLHPQIGYKILKTEMHLPEHICRVALEHHERNDGTGYPYGLSSEQISLSSQIINICNFYDNLTANKVTNMHIKNSKEALKIMLEIGTRWFTADMIFTFIHMSNYNDTILFDALSEDT